MIHYLTLGGKDRPITFTYAIAYEYELQTGKSYETDVQALATQVIVAGAQLGTDDVAAAVQNISMVLYVDIMHAALRVAHLRTRTEIDFDKYDVADWLGADRAAAAQLTTLLLEANFDLKTPPSENGTPRSAKKNAPQRRRAQGK